MDKKPYVYHLGDWACPNCEVIIWAKKDQCTRCGLQRPHPKREKRTGKEDMGDWLCSKCKFVIWAHKSSCAKCGEEQPAMRRNPTV